jgi:hypothetical protein
MDAAAIEACLEARSVCDTLNALESHLLSYPPNGAKIHRLKNILEGVLTAKQYLPLKFGHDISFGQLKKESPRYYEIIASTIQDCIAKFDYKI